MARKSGWTPERRAKFKATWAQKHQKHANGHVNGMVEDPEVIRMARVLQDTAALSRPAKKYVLERLNAAVR
jgi:hypothetical protein